jgi:ribosomal protein S18 acetylase RimI-like enzyme
MEIRPFSDADTEAVVQGFFELQQVEVGLSDTRVVATAEGAHEYLAHVQKMIADHSGAFFCAHEGADLLGFVVCWIERDESLIETPDSTTHGRIPDAFVFEQYRGRGVFSALHKEVEKYFARFPEIKRIRITGLANNVEALRAYHGVGYSDYEVVLEKRTAGDSNSVVPRIRV